MKPKRRKFSTFIFLAILIVIFAASAYGYSFITQFPQQAKVIYGQPSVHLSTLQHYRLSYRLVQNKTLLLEPIGADVEEVQFSVELDQSVDSVIAELAANGLISNTSLFRDYLIYSGLDTQIQAGEYYLNKGMSAVEIASSLLDSTPRYVKISILPGWRIEEIAQSLPSTGVEVTPEDFIQAANQRYNYLDIMQEIPNGVSLEGFFPPGVFEVERTIQADQLVIFLLEKFEQTLPPKILQGLEQQNLSLHEGLILASIIEREAVLLEEMPIISSVLQNRLEISMKLETDPTVQYALGYNSAQKSWWTNPLTYAHLEVISPYNTYLYHDLPPTPIANPSLAALQAVAFPAQTPYFYFRAACDNSGRHNFSETFEQHLGYACQ